MNIPDEAAIASVVAVGGFAAWIIRYMLTDYKTTIENNTIAITKLIENLEKHA